MEKSGKQKLPDTPLPSYMISNPLESFFRNYHRNTLPEIEAFALADSDENFFYDTEASKSKPSFEESSLEAEP